jgi:hypothetical protein
MKEILFSRRAVGVFRPGTATARSRLRIAFATLAILSSVATTAATPLRLDYSVTAIGGGYEYDFQLVLDNNDSSWSAGQNFNWIVFGAEVNSSPIGGEFGSFTWDLTDFPIGPFTAPDTSSGGLAGPNLFQSGTNAQKLGWIPTATGQSLNWSGTSPALLTQGQLHWGNLLGSCTTGLNVVTANEIGAGSPPGQPTTCTSGPSGAPEPTSLFLLSTGLLGLGGTLKCKMTMIRP